MTESRKILTLVSSHQEDEKFVIHALQKISKKIRPILVIIPRHIERAETIRDQCIKADLKCTILSELRETSPSSDVYIANQIGAPAIWLPFTHLALIGGTYCDINGHNPWEPIQFGAAVLHGPKTANFSEDFKELLVSGTWLHSSSRFPSCQVNKTILILQEKRDHIFQILASISLLDFF